MIYKVDLENWTQYQLSGALFKMGLNKMLPDESFVEVVVPSNIFNKLISGLSLKSTYVNRGYKDLIGRYYFKQCSDSIGKIYTKDIVRVWNEDSLLEHMKTGRRVLS